MNNYPFKHLQLYSKDKLVTDIFCNDGEIKMIKYDNRIGYQWFIAEDWKLNEILDLLADRAIPPRRANIKEILASFGMEKYDAIELLKHTHGLSTDDYFWLKFDDEDLEYEDIKIRD